MGLDGDLTGVLREVVQFLECLREVKLPATLESIRDTLLIRSRDTLATLTIERIGKVVRASSPEPYLNMKAGIKGLLPTKLEFGELQEYVDAEESRPRKQQDHYETFQENEPTNAINDSPVAPSAADSRRPNDREIEDTLVDIYATLSATQTKSKCTKCGPLYRKEGKKLFVFEQYRACWAGLVGSHLLVYGNDRESRPCGIHSIRGYMARAAQTVLPRDQRRSESAFEIFRPGSKTLQFVARTPKDMEQWVAKICQMGSIDEEEGTGTPERAIARHDVDVPATDSKEDCQRSKERYPDAGSLNVDRLAQEASPVSKGAENLPTKETSIEESPNPPPLPARIPRRLPSLPTTGCSTTSYEQAEDEEDDIYHKIEDFRDAKCYQNLAKNSASKTKNGEPSAFPTYDDVRETAKEKARAEDKYAEKNGEGETYDDIVNAGAKEKIGATRTKLVSYDDVENLLPKSTSGKVRAAEDSTQSPPKRSFLDRVRSRKESPRKVEKKTKRKTPTPPPLSTEELPTYDDVSDLVDAQEIKSVDEEIPEYNCPPPPRPVCVKPQTMVIEEQELYDDVAACREKYKEESKSMLDQRFPTTQNDQGTTSSNNEGTAPGESIDQRFSPEDCEHYQTPRKDPCQSNRVPVEQQEELYDDIAILADFTARQKVSHGRKDGGEDSKFQTCPEKKPWNRFVSGRKSRTNESTETDSRLFNGIDSVDDIHEQHSLIRMNTFQKLISKMENSLGKASAKTASSLPLNKTNVTNDT